MRGNTNAIAGNEWELIGSVSGNDWLDGLDDEKYNEYLVRVRIATRAYLYTTFPKGCPNAGVVGVYGRQNWGADISITQTSIRMSYIFNLNDTTPIGDAIGTSAMTVYGRR